MGTKAKNHLLRLLIIILTLFVLYRMFAGSIDEIVNELVSLNPLVFVLIVGLIVLYQLIDGTIMTLLIRKHHKSFKWLTGVRVSFEGAFVRGVSFGSATQAGQIVSLLKDGIEPSQSTSALTISYILHRISVILFVVVGVFLNQVFFDTHYSESLQYLQVAFFLNLLLGIFLVLLITSNKFHRFIIAFLNRWVNPKYKKGLYHRAIEQLNVLAQGASSILYDRMLLLLTIGLQIIKLTCYFLIPYLILTLGYGKVFSISIFEMMVVTGFSAAVVGVVPTPAGIGSTEIVFAWLFTTIVGKIDAGATMILYRFFTYIMPFILGVIVRILIERRNRNAV